MIRMITVKGIDTSRGPNPVAVFAPVDCSMVVRDAIILAFPPATHELWQDVAWYFKVDRGASALFQQPGVDLSSTVILVLLEAQ